MSTRIGLTFRRLPDVEFLHRGIAHNRIFCTVQFETPDKDVFIQPAIVDTGAPLCLIPSDLWQQVRTQQFETTQVGGLVGRKECAVSARLGILSMTLLDPQGHRQRLTVRAFLAHTSDVPLILGFQDCLEKATVHVALPRHEAWLEFD
ncbi:MAG: hypothetical protein HY737_03500 [Candidatus Omnitrophica bacterium]|nr:hypothetical protein [Candidatus Omnitrophota bacterium]